MDLELPVAGCPKVEPMASNESLGRVESKPLSMDMLICAHGLCFSFCLQFPVCALAMSFICEELLPGNVS